jgi:predicted transposase YdaD
MIINFKTMKKFVLFTLMFTVISMSVNKVYAQFSKEGPQVETFYSVIDDSEQPYALYLPENFDNEKTYPLVIMLHGAGSNHRLALKRVFGKSNLQGDNDVDASLTSRMGRCGVYCSRTIRRGTMGLLEYPKPTL